MAAQAQSAKPVAFQQPSAAVREVLDAPAEYPHYNGGRGYYAVFFADADGLKLEYVFTPPG